MANSNGLAAANINIPPLPQFPPASIQQHVPPQEWQACLDAWILSVQVRLRMSDADFGRLSAEEVGLAFLVSHLNDHHATTAAQPLNSKLSLLRRVSYALSKRVVLSQADNLSPAQFFDVLGCGSIAFGHTKDWIATLKTIWSTSQMRVRKAIEAARKMMSTSEDLDKQQEWLSRLTALTRSLPETAIVTVSSADYLDTLMLMHMKGPLSTQKAATANIFYSFKALLDLKKISSLTDNIYHMKSEADRIHKEDAQKQTLLSSLLCTTSFFRHFASQAEIATRQGKLVEQLKEYRQHMSHLHPRPPLPRKKDTKGKGVEHGDSDMRIHQAAQISQVHDLFPHLSTSYIMKALEYYSNNVEEVIAALLEPESLPVNLQDQQAADLEPRTDEISNDLAPRAIPPLLPQRKNVFDKDDFDQLQVASGKLRRGKKGLNLEDQSTTARSKAAIMSALAAFDSDDDERDDTYDMADIGGTVDNTVDTDTRPRQAPGQEADMNEAMLFKAWKENPGMFARDSRTRASNLRAQLKRESNMTDEQIEGWAVMLKRDPNMESRLDLKYSAVRSFAGQQTQLRSTKWSAGASTDVSEDEAGLSTKVDDRRMGQAGIRGHRHFGRGRGRGGGAPGSMDAEGVQSTITREGQNQSRGRGGRHSRRDARAKKVGRGMGPLPSS